MILESVLDTLIWGLVVYDVELGAVLGWGKLTQFSL